MAMAGFYTLGLGYAALGLLCYSPAALFVIGTALNSGALLCAVLPLHPAPCRLSLRWQHQSQ